MPHEIFDTVSLFGEFRSSILFTPPPDRASLRPFTHDSLPYTRRTLNSHETPGEIHTLKNGFQLILHEDRSAPVVSVQAWCRAGSIDEGRWLGAGLSHVLEHMLFKGTSTRGAGRIDQEVQAAGGYMNAYTSFDRTVYWINAPNTGCRVAVDILCDILQKATLPAEDLVKELDVIRREMDMGNDDPGRRASRRLFETAFTRSPYRFPIIGLPDLFNRLTREDIATYYTEKYAPNNCFLVVVGDFRPTEVIAQVEAAFAGSPARPIPAVVLPAEPRQTSARETVEEAPIELGHFHLSWHTPDLRHADTPALDVLSTLLGSGRSSRLYQAVRERAGLAHSISAWTYAPGQAGMFGVSGVVDGTKFTTARDAALAEIERMQREAVSTAELTKAVKQFTAGTLATRKTMEGQAQDLGSNWMLANDLSFSQRYLEAVRRLTPQDLQRVACNYLQLENWTTFALLPSGTRSQRTRTAPERTETPVQKITLPNGLRLLLKADHRLPFVQSRIALGGGILTESIDNNGITQLMSKMLVKGTARRTAEQIATEIESIAGSLEPYAGNHCFGLSAEVMREDFATGLDLFADALLNPQWPSDALEREKEIQLAGIRGQRDQLLQCAFSAMRRGMFGKSGYGLDALGTETSVQTLTARQLAAFHKGRVVPSNAVLAIFGDIDLAAVRDAVERQFRDWAGPLPDKIATGAPTIPVGERRSCEQRDKDQAVLALGFPGTTMESPDRYVLQLIQEACSDMGSRLFLRIRDELGLAYYVGTTQFPGRVPGYFAFYCGTAPDQVEKVETELRAQAEALRQEGLTAAELERAKAKIIGQNKIARQDLGHLAMTAALDELYDLGFDHSDGDDARYDAVTLEQVRMVAARYLMAERSVVAVIRGK